METLAYTHVAVHYEELNSSSELRAFRNIKLKALKAVKSIAIAVGCTTAGVVAGTAAQAETVHKTFSYGDKGSGIAILQSKLGGIAVDGIFGSQTLSKLKSYQAAHGLAVDGVATPKTLASIGSLNLAQASNQTPLQQGKLKLINDIPRPIIIYLKKQGDVRYSRYAYLRGCTERTLNAQYSSSWNVSNDLESWHGLNVHRGGVYSVTASSMEKNKEGVKCLGYIKLKESIKKQEEEKHGQRATQVFWSPLSLLDDGIRALSRSDDALVHVANKGIKQTDEAFKLAQQSKQYISPEYQGVNKAYKATEGITDDILRENQAMVNVISQAKENQKKLIDQYLRNNGDTQNFVDIANFTETWINASVLEGAVDPTALRQQLYEFFTVKCGYKVRTVEVVDALVSNAVSVANVTKKINTMSTNNKVVKSQPLMAQAELTPRESLETILKGANCIKNERIRRTEMVLSLAPGQ
ncbi:peptidoglycan-binding protein [Scytonema hofmannii FACHB-248]|uniref:Peptidoglycan-binding protein n=1 Tax=Scytonema hofmannii FACHB-248 TaxID=1842502 RepID=A0ABR8GR72_9CYAN|nr:MULTISPECIES: peptidoglycan-binding domain-containing protein [Nostocales]MBD2605955.1 peptidoglycan-binding protein [Scytonema hofmannii FACHB-248]